MSLKSIEEANFGDERVLVRVDFNVELDRVAEVEEHFRFDIVKKTIDHIAGFSGAKIALLCHFGRPQGEPRQKAGRPEGKRDERYSVGQILFAVERALGRQVVFVPDCIGDAVRTALAALPAGSVLLLENTRFYPGEEGNDPAFAKALAEPFSIFVNEAFSVCHRAHASIVGLPKLLPSYAGFRVLEEVEQLDQVKASPEHPAIAIIGGAKIETKLPLIRTFEKNYDAILVGGKVANEAIDEKIAFSEKVLLPQDFDSPLRLDIGPNTIAYYIRIIRMAKTIVWNGPMGKFEEKPYDIGTAAILQAILDSGAFVVIGGGESLAVVEKANAMGRVGFVSSGGGAMLEYLGGQELPGLSALEA
ncbi:MAG: phosphoglycerate kinase [Patescibacteria group bacterium]